MRYRSGDPVKSGVPLGGIGCGKIELFPDGTIGNITYQNNWRAPLVVAPEGPVDHRVAWHFGIHVKAPGAEPVARLLQTEPVGEIPGVQAIDYEGRYPVAELTYHDDAIPLKISLDAFSPIIPGDSQASGLPAVRFHFRLENPTDQPLAVALLASARNTTSRWVVGRVNHRVNDPELTGIRFTATNPEQYDQMAGDVYLTVPKAAGDVTVDAQYSCKGGRWQLLLANERLPGWPHFAETGRLLDVTDPEPARGERYSPAGALAVRFSLAPGEVKELPVYLSWYMPNHPYGHYYEHLFADGLEAARHLHRQGNELRARVRRWHEIILTAGLPDWLADGLINNLYILTASTWWTKDGRFATFESPLACPLMETLDVRYYNSLPLAWMWPDLERSAMEQFAAAQRESGYIPHDLGNSRLDMPSDGTTAPPLWKDLATKFVLMVYRDWLWWGLDEVFLTQMYPHVVRAMLWQFTTDKNGDGLPDNEGADQTYDAWEFYGTNSYTSSLYLTALRAARTLARVEDDAHFAATLEDRFQRGRSAFLKQLWNGAFFVAVSDGKETYPACTAGQINGMWYARMLEMEMILPPDKVDFAVDSILRYNVPDSPYGVTNSVFTDGRRDESSDHARNIWPGESYVVAAMAIYRGRIAEGLEIARKTWATFTDVVKNPYNQPDVLRPDDASYAFGDSYMRNTAIWAVVFALALRDPKVKAMLDALKGSVAHDRGGR